MKIPARIMALKLPTEIVQVGTYREPGARCQVIDMLRSALTLAPLFANVRLWGVLC